MVAHGVASVKLLATVVLGALVLLGLAACDDMPIPGACGQGGPGGAHGLRPALIFACSAVPVDGSPFYQLWRLRPHGAQRLSSAPAQDPAVARSGSLLAYDSTTRGTPNIYISGLDLGSSRVVAAAAGGQTEPAWSPDGSRIAYVSGEHGLHAPVGVSHMFGRVFVAGAGGGGARAITPEDSFGGQPDWSPDGSRIAYASDALGYWHLVTVAPDGRDSRIVTSDGEAEWPSWSPTGTRLAYQASATLGGDESIWVANANGSDAHRLASGSQPSWSPDGKWIAFVRKTNQGSDLWMISPRGGRAVRLTDDAGQKGRPSWV